MNSKEGRIEEGTATPTPWMEAPCVFLEAIEVKSVEFAKVVSYYFRVCCFTNVTMLLYIQDLVVIFGDEMILFRTR